MPAIPERQPITDSFSGTVLRAGENHVLAAEPHPPAEVAASGNLVIRYAIPYLGKPHLAIVPGLIALDYGDMLTGEEAWDWLLNHSNLHPRADVVGYRSDGVDDMIVVKLLDLAQPVQVLVYQDSSQTKPLARVEALIARQVEAIPPRLLNYLPRYDSLEDWQRRE